MQAHSMPQHRTRACRPYAERMEEGLLIAHASHGMELRGLIVDCGTKHELYGGLSDSQTTALANHHTHMMIPPHPDSVT